MGPSEGTREQKLELGTEFGTYLFCTYISCQLARLDAFDYVNSTNVVARIVLPCMRIPEGRKVEIVARALEGLVTLEANVHKQQKYVEFITLCAGMKKEEQAELKRTVERTPWGKKMLGWLGEAKAEGKAEGLALGKADGKAELLLRLLSWQGLHPTPEQKQLVLRCTDDAQLEAWFDRAFTAKSTEELFGSAHSAGTKSTHH